MNLVVDANILFSFLIKQGKDAEILLNFSFNFYVPEYVFEEIKKHKQEILEKTKRSGEEFRDIVNKIEEIFIIVPREEFEIFLEETKAFCPDKNDTEYFALALKFNCPIWSNDKELKKQNKIKVCSTEDLIDLLKKN